MENKLENKLILNNLLLLLIVGILGYTAFIATEFYSDRNEMLRDIKTAETMANHCRIMLSVGKPCT